MKAPAREARDESDVTPPRYCIKCGNAFTAGTAEAALCAECSGTPAAPEPQGGAGICGQARSWPTPTRS